MPKIEIYTSMICPYCHRAKRTLDSLGLSYEEIEVTLGGNRKQEMIERSNRTTVPQIFIDDYHIGGSDDLEDARTSGLLQKVLDGTHKPG